MKKLFTLFIMLCGMTGILFAQDGLPSNPTESKCYVKCVTPDVYGDSTVQVLVRPEYRTLRTEAPKYKKVTETIVIQEASKRYEYVPAVYKTVYDTVITEEGYNKIAIQEAKFSGSFKTVQLEPKTARWEMGPPAPDCASPNPMDCRVVCWKEYPAKFTQIPTQLLDKDSDITKSRIKPKYKLVKRQIIDKPATTREIAIPEKTTVVERMVLVEDENTVETVVPAEYKDVTIQVLKEKGGLTVWREMECDLTTEEGQVLPIFYNTGSAELTAASRKTIDDNLLELMRREPLIRVEIQSHTDSRGSAASNQALSQRRAQSVVNYLVSKGIARTRLVAKGYGETRLTNNCADGVNCTDLQHSANRRTSFRVISQ